MHLTSDTPSIDNLEMQIHSSLMPYYCIWSSQLFPQGYRHAFTEKNISCLLGGSFSMLRTCCVHPLHFKPPSGESGFRQACWIERLGMVRLRILGECQFQEPHNNEGRVSKMVASWRPAESYMKLSMHSCVLAISLHLGRVLLRRGSTLGDYHPL